MTDTAGGLRALCVTETFPWPPASGYQLRMLTAIRGLAEVASVDLWVASLEPDPPERFVAPTGAPVGRARVVRAPRRSRARRLACWATGRLPRALLEVAPRSLRRDLTSWTDGGTYDLVWCGHLRTYIWLRDVLRAGLAAEDAVVLDLDDLGDSILVHRRQAQREWRPRRRGGSAARDLVARVADRIDARRYTRLHRRVAAEVRAVVVCSEIDRARLGVANTVVVPNSYPAPPVPARRRAPDRAEPVLLLVGRLDYAPNADGARSFVERVLPAVRAQLPGATLRVVGRGCDDLADLTRRDGVELVGEVDDVGPELRAADVAVVPLRFGGGTRVKVLEAFAWRVPVVSTTVGCEGLAVTPGEHLVAADAPEAMARACVEVVTDEALRARLTDRAFELYDTCYRTETVERLVAATAAAARGPS